MRSTLSGVTKPGGARVSDETRYDLASLTKVLCTVSLLLDRVARGLLDPRAPLRELLPEAAWMQGTPSLAAARLIDLVTHTSGLPAWQPLYTLGLDRATLLAHVSRRTERYAWPHRIPDLGYICRHLLGAPRR